MIYECKIFNTTLLFLSSLSIAQETNPLHKKAVLAPLKTPTGTNQAKQSNMGIR
jgi:hypothetical protein